MKNLKYILSKGAWTILLTLVVMCCHINLNIALAKSPSRAVISSYSFLQKNGVYINALKAGAHGDGKHDDAFVIQHLVDSVNSIGGGTIYFPAGTYLLNSVLPKSTVVILLHSNVNISGAGIKTIFKLGDNLENTHLSLRIFYFQPNNKETTLNNVVYSNFVIDCNGGNNSPNSKEMAKKYKGTALGSQFANNVTIDNISVQNNAGRTTFAFANSGTQFGVKHVVIENCNIHNVAKSVRGNQYQNDHSAIYVRGDSCLIKNNKLTNDELLTGATAIEIHCSHTDVFGNYVENFSKALNVAAVLNDVIGINIKHNTFHNVYTCLMLWVYSNHKVSDIAVTDNIGQIQGGLYPVFDLQTQVKFPYKNLMLSNNTFNIYNKAGSVKKSDIMTNQVSELKNVNNTFSVLK